MAIKITNNEFKKRLKEKFPNYEKDYIIIGEYIDSRTKILLIDKYGLCSMKPNNLMNGAKSNICSAVDKDSYFKKMLLEKNKKAMELIFLNKYETNLTELYLIDKYGILKTNGSNLLSDKLPDINSAVYKHDYFMERLKEGNYKAYCSLKFLNKYKNSEHRIIVEDEYGICEILPRVLLNGHFPDIRSAINKQKYFINMVNIKNPKFFIDNEIISDYKDMKTKIRIKTKYGKAEMTPSSIISGKFPDPRSHIEKNNYYINILKDVNKDIFNYEILDEIWELEDRIRIKDKYGICNMSVKSLLQGSTPSLISAIDKVKYIKNQFKEVHGDLYDYSLFTKYKNHQDIIDIKCKKHGLFKQCINSHKSGSGCLRCNSSLGENKICSIFDKFKIEYKQQKRFDKCRKVNTLPFDFYIKEKNILIEYDGRQHYELSFWGNTSEEESINNLRETKENDEIKNRYCKDNNIELIRIPYWNFDKIEEILIKELGL